MSYTKEDIIRMVKEEDIEFVRLQFTDIFGQLKNVAITATFEVVKKGEEVTKPDGTVKFSPGRIVMKATAVNQRGEVVVEGEACSMAAREKVDCSRF